MALKGRKPKPTNLKILQGNAGRRPLNKTDISVEVLEKAPECPEWIGRHGAEVWARVADWLVGSKILAESDTHNLEAFCSAYQNYRDASEHIRLHGLVITNQNGELKKNPACTVVAESLRQMNVYGASLGLDPASRTRLAAPNENQENPFESLLRKTEGAR
jgi:P27 family predicted phage terminase small subunit